MSASDTFLCIFKVFWLLISTSQGGEAFIRQGAFSRINMVCNYNYRYMKVNWLTDNKNVGL